MGVDNSRSSCLLPHPKLTLLMGTGPYGPTRLANRRGPFSSQFCFVSSPPLPPPSRVSIMAEYDPLGYWTRWQVPVCALIVGAPAVAAAAVVVRSKSDPIRPSDLWRPCWKRVHPLWLLAYRALVCVAMSYLLIEMLLRRGLRAFCFYTQWTFALVILYFLIATFLSAHGCWVYSRRHVTENEEVVRRLLERDFEANLPEILTSRTHENGNAIKLQNYHEQAENEQIAGFWGYTMQVVYQTSGGAVLLTDIIFWGLLVPFASPDYLSLNPIRGCIHSLNAVFLILDTALNRLHFPFFRMAYFVLWSFAYVTFQWILHACGLQWWPYPFLDLASPWAPAWYLCMALFHIPCYGMYSLIVKAKNSACCKSFPHACVRTP